MKLTGFGPWGVEKVSRATKVNVRTLHDWHKRGVAKASGRAGHRECLRYSREDVERVCRIAAARARKLPLKRTVELVDAMDQHIAATFHVEPRPSVSFAAI